MKFFYYFAGRWVPIDTALLSGRVYNRLAVAAEKAGFYGVCMDEHPAPVKSWLTGHGHHCFDPFVMLAAAGAVAPKLRLMTYLAILPYRNPFQFTKAATSLDVMSDGRAIIGVGVGYMKGEFDALGVDFEKRNALFEESIDVYRRACGGDYVSYKGSNFVADEVQILPQAVQQSHPPLWLGGNSTLTLRRVAEYAQGWLPMPLKRNAGGLHKVPPLENVDDLRGYVQKIGAFKAKAGRKDATDVVISSQMIDLKASPAGIVEQIKAFQAAGATGVTINGQGKTPDEAVAFIERFGADIIAQFAA
jgi:probable F420-dependent oxidoreductase